MREGVFHVRNVDRFDKCILEARIGGCFDVADMPGNVFGFEALLLVQ